jgi:class 3 adenylate cyclase/tetratricopeptide (TPR) repeat protein
LVDHKASSAVDLQQKLDLAQDAVHRLRRYIPSVVADGILYDQERLRGERREVTILFVDVVNFTSLSASLDAEPLFELINGLLGRLMECVHRYAGVVDKFLGDGLMAIFGAPLAHENDMELAVRSALDMQKAIAELGPVARAQLGAPLQIRIGVHCGPVIAGSIGVQEQAAYTVIGETVNLASRLESLARPGHILVSERVYHHTRALFNFQAMGAAQVKGFEQPVIVYEAMGDRSEALPTRGVAGVATILLGRDVEQEQLQDLWFAFMADRHGRLVVIQGEAGIGKSRLISEWLSIVPPDRVAIWHGRGLPYAQGVGYGIFRSLLQDVQRACPPGVDWDARVSPTLRPLLRDLLGQSSPEEQANLRHLEPGLVKQLTILALREWLLGEAGQRPVALILEDFHWADDLSLEVLQMLIDLTARAPVLLCVVMRPRPEAPLRVELPPVDEPLMVPLSLEIELEPLSPQHSRTLLGHLVDLQGMPEAFVETILTRAEGNPFYIEEFVRMLIEKGMLTLGDGQWQVALRVELEQQEIPTSLRGLMMARVDRLPENLRHLLRFASVIGLEFSADLLEEVSRRRQGVTGVLPRLERLVDLGVLVKRPGADEQIFAFRHILTQETIYSSLMRHQRPRLHHTVAECVEELYAADLSQYVEILALHYDRARERDQAMHYALLAGDRAGERFVNREAIEYYSRALQLAQHLSGYEAEKWQAVVGLGKVHQHTSEYEEAITYYQAALADWSEAAHQDCAQVMLDLGQAYFHRGDLPAAEEWLQQSLTQLDLAPDVFFGLRAQVYSELGWIRARQGDLTLAQEWFEKGLELVENTEHYSALSSLFNRLGFVHFRRNDWEHAVTCVERALELRERLGDDVGYARSLNNLAILKRASGNWDGALLDYERAIELHERMGAVEGLALACANLGVLYTDRGDWARAGEHLERSLDIARRIAHPFMLARAHHNLGRLYLLEERWADCARHLKSAAPLYQQAGARASVDLSDLYVLQGDLCLAQGQVDAAAQWAERSHELLQDATGRESGESDEWGRYERLMGRVALERGDLDAAELYLERSAVALEKSSSWLESGRVVYWLALLSFKRRQLDKAREELLLAQQVFYQLKATVDLQRVEDWLARIDAADQADQGNK